MLSKIRKTGQKWNGVFLALITAVSTVWLAANGKLDLYVHPRYIIFNVTFALLFITACGALFWVNAKIDLPPIGKLRQYGLVGAGIVSLFVMLILPPMSLTSATVSQRGVNVSGTVSDTMFETSPDLFNNDEASTRLTIRDWSALLGQAQDAKFFTGKEVNVVGIIAPDEYDPDNIFYVTRFVVSCCAIDAQAIGIPIYAPDWKKTFKENDWVRVKGSFIEQNYRSARAPAIIRPDTIEPTNQPDDPYVF